MKPIAAFFISSLLVGQVPTSLNFGSPAVSAPIPSATKVGATGFTNTFYWVVARTPGGYTSPGAAIATNTVGSANFSVSNYVVISWPAISGATGYDVIRSDSPSYPASTSCASCAVALNQAGTSFSDQGGATSAYSGGAQSVASQAIFTLDNVTVATPQVNVQILNSRQNVTFALPSTGVGSVTSVGMTVPGALLSVSGSPITTSGTLAVSLVTQSANCVFAGPTSGGAATPTCRALVSADLPAGTGTVTSVGLSLPSIITVSGSPVTGSGTLTGTLATQTANTIWAGPTTGAAAAPTFRALVAADLPSGTIIGSLTANQIAYGSASNTITGSAGLTFSDAANIRLATLAGGSSQSTNPLLDVTNSAGSSHWLTVLGDGKVGVGTNAPGNKLQVAGAGIFTGTWVNDGATSGISLSYGDLANSGRLQIFSPGVAYRPFDMFVASLNVATGTGSVTSALTVTNGGITGIGKSNTTPANATLSVLDATPASGATATWIGHDGSGTYSGVHLSALATSLKVVAGLTQGSTNLQEWQNLSGTVLAYVANDASIIAPAFVQNGALAGMNSGGVRLGTSAGVLFGSTANYASTADTSLSRISAGIIGGGTGSAGSVAGSFQATKYISAGTAFVTWGTGTPEAAVTATVGSMFLRTDGGAATTLYVKESGSGNTGWIAK